MGERAQRGYEQDERDAFRRLPWRARLKANAVALCIVGGLLALMVFYAVWPMVA